MAIALGESFLSTRPSSLIIFGSGKVRLFMGIMSLSGNVDECVDKLVPVLKKHLATTSEGEACLIAQIMVSIAQAKQSESFERRHIQAVGAACEELEEVAKAISKSLHLISSLGEIPREALSRSSMGMADFPEFEGNSLVKIMINLGYRNKVDELEEAQRAQLQVVENALSALSPHRVKISGRPPEQGAFALAELCARAYAEYVGEPAQPSWDNYPGGPSGPFFAMVKDVFKALGVEQRPRSFARKAVEAIDSEREKTSPKK